ncbi:MAG: hypothetical protein WC144_05960 [Sulfurimonas sp.]|jgi:hypothetical protein|nr:hypothetical protein [Sulfurimonadaceae bacterium]
MFKLLFLLLISFGSLFASKDVAIDADIQKSLEQLNKYSIVFGKGKSSEVYVFVDPLCSYSRALMQKIYDNKMLHLSNTYRILFYRLPRLDSAKTIEYILESQDKKAMLISIMIEDMKPDLENFTAKDETKNIVKEIAKVAQTLDMTQRPYMISFDKDSPYCRVSEGIVSCLEEFDEDD